MPKHKKKPPAAVKLLFIGNSFTQRNDLPGMLQDLALARGLLLSHDLISVGGASLRTHWNAGRAVEAISSGGYDYVVLQEQSTLPITNARRMAENIRLFDDAIERAKSKTVLYMTWAREHSPDSQQAITNAYNSIGNELGSVIVPVGVVWQKFSAKHAQPPLYDRDQSHPSVAGSYLAACVFLSVLFSATPVGIETGPSEITSAHRQMIQKAVWKQFGS